MANITIRNIPDATKQALRVYAAQSGQSLEGYIRQMLQKAASLNVVEQESILDIAHHYFGKGQGIDLVLPHRASHRPVVEFET